MLIGVLLRVLRSPQGEPPKLVAINSGDVAVSDENTEIDTTTIVETSEKITEVISKGNENTEIDTKDIEETGDTPTEEIK